MKRKRTVTYRRRNARAHREREPSHEVCTRDVRVIERVEVVRCGRGAEVADVLAEGVDGGSFFFFEREREVERRSRLSFVFVSTAAAVEIACNSF